MSGNFRLILLTSQQHKPISLNRRLISSFLMNVVTKNVASSNITNDFSIYTLLLNFLHIYHRHIYHRTYLHKITKHSTPAETIALDDRFARNNRVP